MKSAVAHGNDLYLSCVSDVSCDVFSPSSVFFPPKTLDNFSVNAHHVNRLIGHSPLRACDQKISAVGPSNRARSAFLFASFASHLCFPEIRFHALLIIFHPTKIIPPIRARLLTPHRNCFCSGFMLV